MRWKVRFHVKAPLDAPFDFATPVGEFRGNPIFPNKDGSRGWCFETYTNTGNDPADAIRDVMPGMLKIIQNLEHISGIGMIVVFDVFEIFSSENPNALSLSNDEIRNLNLSSQPYFQRLYIFPEQPPVQEISQNDMNFEVSDIAAMNTRNVTPEFLQEIQQNL